MEDECKECIGCKANGTCVFWKHTKYQLICPCTKCVVKVMCNTVCDDFDETYRVYHKEINNE